MFSTLLKFFGFPDPIAPPPRAISSMEAHFADKVREIERELNAFKVMSLSGVNCQSMISHYEQNLTDAKRELNSIRAHYILYN
jgi:hypothetical protein